MSSKYPERHSMGVVLELGSVFKVTVTPVSEVLRRPGSLERQRTRVFGVPQTPASEACDKGSIPRRTRLTRAAAHDALRDPHYTLAHYGFVYRRNLSRTQAAR